MNALEWYLADLERRLLIRRHARQAILAELRGHLEVLEAERGAPFATVQEVRDAFGEPRLLARRLNATVPWRQARPPWTLLAIGPVALVAASTVVAILLLPYASLTITDAPSFLRLALIMGMLWLSYLSAPLVTMAWAARQGARPLHTVVAIVGVPLVLTVLALVQCLGPGAHGSGPGIPENLGIQGFYLLLSIVCAWAATGASVRRARQVLGAVAAVGVPVLIGLNLDPRSASACALALGLPVAVLTVIAALPWLTRGAEDDAPVAIPSR